MSTTRIVIEAYITIWRGVRRTRGGGGGALPNSESGTVGGRSGRRRRGSVPTPLGLCATSELPLFDTRTRASARKDAVCCRACRACRALPSPLPHHGRARVLAPALLDLETMDTAHDALALLAIHLLELSAHFIPRPATGR
jgi:hypothetical protein